MGLTPSVQLYAGGTPIGSPFAATEIDSTGEYLCPLSGISAGHYLAIATVGTDVKIAAADFYWDGYNIVEAEMIGDVHRLMGLDTNTPAIITPTSQTAGDISIDIGGDGINLTTLHRT